MAILKKEKIKKETRVMDCILTTDEIRERAETMAHTLQEKTEILAEKKEIMSGFKQKLESCDKVILSCANAVNTGKEERDVECDIKLNTPKSGLKIVIRTDTGEEIEEKMTDLELQEEMF